MRSLYTMGQMRVAMTMRAMRLTAGAFLVLCTDAGVDAYSLSFFMAA